METKQCLEDSLRAAKGALLEASNRVHEIEGKLFVISEQERVAHEKANSGTRIEEVKDHPSNTFVIARGPYLARPKYFQMYVDGQPYWGKGLGAWGAGKFKTREDAEAGMVEIKAAEKEARLARKK